MEKNYSCAHLKINFLLIFLYYAKGHDDNAWILILSVLSVIFKNSNCQITWPLFFKYLKIVIFQIFKTRYFKLQFCTDSNAFWSVMNECVSKSFVCFVSLQNGKGSTEKQVEKSPWMTISVIGNLFAKGPEYFRFRASFDENISTTPVLSVPKICIHLTGWWKLINKLLSF